MSTESRIDTLQQEIDECTKALKRVNVNLSCFALSYIAAVPTLLRIMERINPNDGDVRYLIDLFEKSGFEFDQFKDQYQAVLEAQSNLKDNSQTQELIEPSYVEIRMFADLIRRSYSSTDSETQEEIKEMLCPQK